MTAADDMRVKSAKAMAHLSGVLTRFDGSIYVDDASRMDGKQEHLISFRAPWKSELRLV